MPKKIEGYSAEITVDNKASKQLEKIIKDNEKLSNGMNKLERNMQGASKQAEKSAMANQKLNNEIVRMRNNMDRLGAKKTKVRVDDKDITKTTKALKELNQFLKKPMHLSINGIKSAASSIKGIIRDLTSLQTIATGVAIGYGVGYGVSSIYENTVGKSMNTQLESVVLQTMAKTRKLNGKEIESKLRDRALDSIMPTDDFIASGRAYIPYASKTKQVMGLTELTERLGLYDPQQGMPGARFAIKELLSGESKSLRTRFELPAKAVKDIEKFVDKADMQKSSNIDKFIVLMNKTLSSAGIGDDFIKQIESTSFAQYQMFKEYFVKGLTMMGDKVLPDVNKRLVEFNKRLDSGGLDRFVKVGGKGLKFVNDSFMLLVDTIDSRGPQIERWFDNTFSFLNSTLRDLKSGKKSLGDAVNELLNKMLSSINGWIKDNNAAISATTGTIVGVMATGLVSNAPILVDAGFKLGEAVIQGFLDSISQSTLGQFIIGGSKDLFSGYKYGPAVAGYKTIGGHVTRAYDAITKPKTTSITPGKQPFKYNPDPLKKKAIGGKIPYDNFPALLHEGETVLTKQESKSQKSGEAALISGNNFYIREEADIYKVAVALVQLLKKERVAYGGEW